jgi:hypothetical protein
LFDVDPLSPIVEYEEATIPRSPSPSPPSPPPLPSLVQEVDDQKELQAQEEMQQTFCWLTDILHNNQKRGWGTAYRDFVDVLLLLKAVGALGMVELGNNRVSDGVFSASIGEFRLTLATFINIMDLAYTPSTWKNKLTMYFRLKALYLYSQHAGRIDFQDPVHNSAWGIVSCWMEHRDKILEENWVTTRFGNTELRGLLRNMLQEAYKGKCIFSLTTRFVL